MVKGVKKIKWSGVGVVKSNLSTPNKKVVIAPDQLVFFEVEKWYDKTPETDKKKHITWLFQDQKTKKIVLQKTLPANNQYGIKLPKNLCGPFEYYLEASLSGKRDVINKTGLLISGNCPAKIISSKLCTSNDGKDVRKQHYFNYGETVYLNLMTEGLNGNLNLSIDVFRNISGKNDPSIFRYTSVDVIDGEINLEIKNTFAWYSKIKNMKETEEFYVKVFDPANKIYIPDNNNDTIHARFLRIKKEIASIETKPPTNLSPLKNGEPEKNFKKPSSCRYNKITVSDVDNNKNKFDLILYDSVTTKNVLEYETIAGSSDDKKKSLNFTFSDLDTSKACFNKGKADEHKKEVTIYLNGVKQKTEVIKKEKFDLELIADSNLLVLKATPELFFITPDKINKYQIFAHTCALPKGVINLNVYPNVEREAAFILTAFKSFNKERNVKKNKDKPGYGIGRNNSITTYNEGKGMKLVDKELEVLYQKKGGLGFGLQAKVKVDNIISSVELGSTKNQIKELISFTNKVQLYIKQFDGRGKENSSLALKQGCYPKTTYDFELPNVAFALRMTNKKIQNTNKVVTQYTGGLALKPMLSFKVGVDLLTLIQYLGVQGKIVDWLIKTFLEQAKIEIYIIFEIGVQVRAEYNLSYNEIEGLQDGTGKLEVEVPATVKIGIKSKNKITVTIVKPDGTTDKADVEEYKAEGGLTASLIYTGELKSDNKGLYRTQKVEFTGVKATLIVYAIGEGMNYNLYTKKEFTIIEKPQEPIVKPTKIYFK